ELPRKPSLPLEGLSREHIFHGIGSFQLPLYMHFMAKDFMGCRLNAGLYSLRDADIQWMFNAKHPYQPMEQFLAPFWQALDYIVGEIMDPSRPFIDDDLRNYE